MSARDRIREALGYASEDWRPVLLAELLAAELRRAEIRGRLDSRLRQQVTYHLNRAAEAISTGTERHALEIGDEVVVQLPATALFRARQATGRIARLTGTLLWLEGADAPWPRLSVIRNLTIRPDAADQPEGVA